ncbi:membrane protein insertase YidC [Chitinophagales bacterium]|nr:membrane protein insertase YidC [Chitinophagales bacterium]
MDRNTIIGFILLAILFQLYLFMNPPEQLQEEKEKTEQVEAAASTDPANSGANATNPAATNSEIAPAIVGGRATGGAGELTTFANDKLSLELSSKGGRIEEVELLDYLKSNREDKIKILEGATNRFDYSFNVDGVNFRTQDYVFEKTFADASRVTYRYTLDENSYLEQEYRMTDDPYIIDYDFRMVGIADHLQPNSQIALNWEVDIMQQEDDSSNERYYSGLYYRYWEKDVENLSEASDAEEELDFDELHWAGMKQQFFNQTLIAKESMKGVKVSSTAPEDEESTILERMEVDLALGYDNEQDKTYSFQWLLSPNDYSNLKSKEMGLENMVYLGWWIFRIVNKYLIMPGFNFLGSFIGNYGIVILLLTLLIKLLLSPLTFKQFKSMAAMKVIQPEVAAIKEKYPDDAQKAQQETMKLYSSAGVNPLGGCLPMMLQMPILIAMYSFFPSALELRQESFLWADDLSTYDSIFNLPFEIPFYGMHVSLFALLTAIASLMYSRMNSSMQSQDNPQVKIMTTVMPIFLIFIFNSFSAALTFYYFLYNVFSMAQHWIIKRFFVDDDAIRAQIATNKQKPKKEGGFQQRLEKMMREQQQKMEKPDKKGK